LDEKERIPFQTLKQKNKALFCKKTIKEVNKVKMYMQLDEYQSLSPNAVKEIEQTVTGLTQAYEADNDILIDHEILREAA